MRYRLAAGDSLSDLRAPSDPEAPFRTLVGRSPVFRRAVEAAIRTAGLSSPTILLVGEAGSGKELFARAIHAAGHVFDTASVQAPFVPIDCASLPSRVLETEVFGQEQERFGEPKSEKQGLLELVGTGTLFLDEVGELPLDIQPKLLKALEERTVRRVGGYQEAAVLCRVIAATSDPLEEAVVQGRFRDDLFGRLSILKVAVPPLRERGGDILLLAQHFLEEWAENGGLPLFGLSPEALRVLEGHSWPGNIRELKTVVHQAALKCDGETLLPRHLSISRRTAMRSGENADAAGFIAIPATGRSLASVEADAVRLTLRLTGWNRSAAARILEISRPTLARKVELYGIVPDETPGGAPTPGSAH